VFVRHLVALLCLGLALPPPGLAQTPARPVALDEAVRLFAANSPDLAAARADAARAARERDVFVPDSGAEAARELLVAADLMPSASATPMPRPNAAKLMAGFLGGATLTALVAWVLIELTG